MKKLKPSKLTAISPKVIIVLAGIFVGTPILCFAIGRVWLKHANQAPVGDATLLFAETTPIPSEPPLELLPSNSATNEATLWEIPVNTSITPLKRTTTTPFPECGRKNGEYEYNYASRTFALENLYTATADNYEPIVVGQAIYFPDFSQELNTPGAAKIQRYYQLKFQTEQQKTNLASVLSTKLDDEMYRYRWSVSNIPPNPDDIAWGAATDTHVECLNYSRAYYGNYLNVDHITQAFSQGAWYSDYAISHSEVFDLTTGELLKLSDIFIDETHYIYAITSAIYEECPRSMEHITTSDYSEIAPGINELKQLPIFQDYPFDDNQAVQFRFAKEGVELIFSRDHVCARTCPCGIVLPYDQTKIQI